MIGYGLRLIDKVLSNQHLLPVQPFSDAVPDAALDLLVHLEESRFPASTRLKRERALDPEELYAVGFALAETHGAGRRIAEDILGHLAARHPRTKVGKSARNKLALSA